MASLVLDFTNILVPTGASYPWENYLCWQISNPHFWLKQAVQGEMWWLGLRLPYDPEIAKPWEDPKANCGVERRLREVVQGVLADSWIPPDVTIRANFNDGMVFGFKHQNAARVFIRPVMDACAPALHICAGIGLSIDEMMKGLEKAKPSQWMIIERPGETRLCA